MTQKSAWFYVAIELKKLKQVKESYLDVNEATEVITHSKGAWIVANFQ